MDDYNIDYSNYLNYDTSRVYQLMDDYNIDYSNYLKYDTSRVYKLMDDYNIQNFSGANICTRVYMHHLSTVTELR